MDEELKKQYEGMQSLDRDARRKLSRQLLLQKPDFLKDFTPKWWWFRPCEVKVLLVCDGDLNFGPGGFGLSEFITTFKKLELQSLTNIRYKVTLAHRSASPTGLDPMHTGISSSVIVNRITGFNFDNSVTLSSFDQVWLFGINSGASLSAAELAKIESYMNTGGGLFATGDHGSLGSALCGQITRVKDMRIWADAPPSPNDLNEVSMNGRRRNDTNRPGIGEFVSTKFDNQSDTIPQTIAPRIFASGLPHPLLSIPTSLRPSGIIDIMPDHPHEGECKRDQVFTVTNPVTNASQNVTSQVIAISYVLGGSTTVFGGKTATDPHCFPSIHVFDGRVANVGRIVVDSTWHHFVNVNLNGSGSGLDNGPQPGLNTPEFDVIQYYYMNIARWMTRRKIMFCWKKWIISNLLLESQLIEASLNEPRQKLPEISLADLYSIGMLAKEIVAEKFSPAFAEEFMLDLLEPTSPEMVNAFYPFKPSDPDNKEGFKGYYQDWIQLDNLVGTAIGAGFVALRDKVLPNLEKMTEKMFESLPDAFDEGVKFGYKVAVANLNERFVSLSNTLVPGKKK